MLMKTALNGEKTMPQKLVKVENNTNAVSFLLCSNLKTIKVVQLLCKILNITVICLNT